MNTLTRILGAAVLILGTLGIVSFGVESCRRQQGSGAEVQANIAAGEAQTHEAQAGKADATVQDLQAKLDSKAKDLDRVSKERDALLKRLAAKPVPHVDPVVPNPGADTLDALEAAIADRDEVIAKDAELITVQAETITKQVQTIQVLTVARDEWRATAEARERQALAQEAATKAWKGAVSSAEWKGRAQGAGTVGTVWALTRLLGNL